MSPEHLDAYLNEFTFRFNRRTSRRRGLLFYRLLEQAVVTDPLSYRDLIVNPRSCGAGLLFHCTPPRPCLPRGRGAWQRPPAPDLDRDPL